MNKLKYWTSQIVYNILCTSHISSDEMVKMTSLGMEKISYSQIIRSKKQRSTHCNC